VLTSSQQWSILAIEFVLESAMKAKTYTLLTVRMPPDLQNVLETISAEKGESVSTIVRDMVRKVASDGRRVDLGVSLASGPNAKDFR
jgi:hypothetical protein